eukprot:TRINITY_DN175_c0_g1_i1.p1 TRINITY_DN175_c0_g1~~TRINITY_DN175_c0_g1_i1.p1  ORF type:complete len:875 (+),score=218.65 TRINITY_DN175_c0_g1_i1:289-2625(+)
MTTRIKCLTWSETEQQLLFVVGEENWLYELIRHEQTNYIRYVTDVTQGAFQGIDRGDCAVEEDNNVLLTWNQRPMNADREYMVSLGFPNNYVLDVRDPLYRQYNTDPGEQFDDPGVAVFNGATLIAQNTRSILLQDASGYVGVVDQQHAGSSVFTLEANPETNLLWGGRTLRSLRFGTEAEVRQYFLNPLGTDGLTSTWTAAAYIGTTSNKLSSGRGGSFAFAPVAVPSIRPLAPHGCCAAYLISFDYPVPNIANAAGLVTRGMGGAAYDVLPLSDSTLDVSFPGEADNIELFVPADFGGIRSFLVTSIANQQTYSGRALPFISVGTNRILSGDVVAIHAAIRPPRTINVPLGSNWGAEIEWDLDGDDDYGETGAEAMHGDEVGTIVQLETRARNGTGGFNNGDVRICARITSGCQCSSEPVCQFLTIVNTPPTIDIGGPYTTSGSSVEITAQGDDSSLDDLRELEYEWDLDGDFVFGETGAAATNGDEVGQTVTFTSGVITPTREFIIRARAFDGELRSRVDQTVVTIPGLAATRECPCPVTALPALSSLTLLESAVFDPQDPYSVLLTQANSLSAGESWGAVYRDEPFTFNIETDIGFELCAEVQASNIQYNDGVTGSPDEFDGGVSFVITSAPDAASCAGCLCPGCDGAGAGLVNRPRTTGVAIRLTSERAWVEYGNTDGFFSTERYAGYPATDAHVHHLHLRYHASTRTLETYVDGVTRELLQFDLFDPDVLGMDGPEFTVFYGFAASTSQDIAHDIRVNTDFSLCKRSDFPPI